MSNAIVKGNRNEPNNPAAYKKRRMKGSKCAPWNDWWQEQHCFTRTKIGYKKARPDKYKNIERESIRYLECA